MKMYKVTITAIVYREAKNAEKAQEEALTLLYDADVPQNELEIDVVEAGQQ